MRSRFSHFVARLIYVLRSKMEENIIAIQGLGKVFRTASGDFTALEDIHLEIKKGHIQGIIGLSGAGKSTLVRCINYLERPSSGQIFFRGKSLSTMKEKEILAMRQNMGMIFQQFNLLEQRNLLQNVCFPLEIAEKGNIFERMMQRGARKKKRVERAKEQRVILPSFQGDRSKESRLQERWLRARKCSSVMRQPRHWTRKLRSRFSSF